MTTVNPQHVLAARRVECADDGLYFCRYFFKHRFATKMAIGRHHEIMQKNKQNSGSPINYSQTNDQDENLTESQKNTVSSSVLLTD